jgi:hypothetical protein
VFLKSRRGDSATDDRAALTSTCEEDTVKTHAFFFSLFSSLFVRDARRRHLSREDCHRRDTAFRLPLGA